MMKSIWWDFNWAFGREDARIGDSQCKEQLWKKGEGTYFGFETRNKIEATIRGFPIIKKNDVQGMPIKRKWKCVTNIYI